MKTFIEFIESQNNQVFNFLLEKYVYRIDPQKRDFSTADSFKQYYITPSGDSGPVPAPDTVPSWGKSLQGSFKRGLHAGRYHDIVSYLIPRELPWILVPTNPKKTLYIRKQDIPAVQSYSPWISSFNQTDFEVLGREGQGEYFTEKPPQTQKQSQIKNVWRILQNKFNVQPVDDIMAIHKQLIAQNIGFDAEGEIFVAQ